MNGGIGFENAGEKRSNSLNYANYSDAEYEHGNHRLAYYVARCAMIACAYVAANEHGKACAKSTADSVYKPRRGRIYRYGGGCICAE